MTKTLLEMSEDYKDSDPKRAEVLKLFAQNSDLLRALVFEDIPGSSFSYNLDYSGFGGIFFRGYNGCAPKVTSNIGIVNPQTEQLRLAGGHLGVDAQIIKFRGMKQRDVHESMKIKALALKFTGCIINGDSDLNIREFDGIKKRITGQQLVGVNKDVPYSNGPFSLSALDEAIKRVDGPTHIIISKPLQRLLTTFSENEKGDDPLVVVSEDEYGFKSLRYKEIPILIADYDNTGARIIDFNEEGPGGAAVGSNCASVYVISIGVNKMMGIQNDVMDVHDLGLLEDRTLYMTIVEWLVGLTVMNGKAAARVWGITDAPVTE